MRFAQFSDLVITIRFGCLLVGADSRRSRLAVENPGSRPRSLEPKVKAHSLEPTGPRVQACSLEPAGPQFSPKRSRSSVLWSPGSLKHVLRQASFQLV